MEAERVRKILGKDRSSVLSDQIAPDETVPDETGKRHGLGRRLGLVIGALLVLEAAALGLKGWEEKQSRDAAGLQSLQREAFALAQRLDGQASTILSAVSLGQKAGAGRELITDALPGLDAVLTLRDAASSPAGSRIRLAADGAMEALARGETVTLSANGDAVFVVEQTGFPTVIAFARAEAWLPAASSGFRFTLAGNGNVRVGRGDASLKTQADTATLNTPQIQNSGDLVRAATACAPLSSTSARACITRPAPMFTQADLLRFAAYAFLLAAPLLAIFGLMQLVSRSRAEAASESERAVSAQTQLDLVMSGAKAGSWTWNTDTSTAEISPMAAELLCLPGAGEIKLDDLMGQIAEGDRATVSEAFEQAGAKGWLQVAFATDRSGGRDFVELRASPKGEDAVILSGIVMDVSQQKRADIRLRMAERRLRNAIEGFSGPFALWDKRRRLLYWNRSYAITFGLEDTLRPGISHDTVELAMAGAIRKQKIDDSDPNSCLIELFSGQWLKTVERETAEGGMITVSVDVTDTVKNEQLLERQKVKLKSVVGELERSEGRAKTLAEQYEIQKRKAEHAANTKSAFLANMSHELRTPLNAINGFSEIIAQELYGPLGDEKYKGYAEDILNSGQHLLDLINDILDMAKIEAGKMTISLDTLDPVDPVDAAIRMIRRKAEDKSVQLVLDAPTNLPEIEADHRAIRQMVLNLIANALKFTDAEGRITVSLRVQDKYLRISVLDTGVGIPKEQIARLGRPFEQVTESHDRNYEGTGLGLALTKSFAEMHGGRIGIASQVGKGTRVSIYLPLERQGLELPELDYPSVPPPAPAAE